MRMYVCMYVCLHPSLSHKYPVYATRHKAIDKYVPLDVFSWTRNVEVTHDE